MSAGRVGIVGAGTIGRTHLKAYREAGATPVAVTDIDQQAARVLAAEFGVAAYPDLATMVEVGDLDAVSVCTPPAGHQQAAIQALQAGIPVLCEKPMARTPADCAAMIDAAERSGTLLTVGFCHRFQPEVETLRALLRDGRIGTPLTFRNRFSGPLDGVENRWFSRADVAGGGVLMDTSVHSVDLFRYLIGEIDQLAAVTATTHTDRGPALEVEDTAILAVRSGHGVVGVIEASWRTAPGEAVISVCGTQGRLDFDYATGALTLTDPNGTRSDLPKAVDADQGDRFARQARHFLDCIADHDRPRVTMHDGARAVELIATAVARSFATP
jgi:predicted dehydrogenase